jgi:hypothetical protein
MEQKQDLRLRTEKKPEVKLKKRDWLKRQWERCSQ